MDDYDIATCATEHADKVLRASGSALKHYTTPAVKKAILSAMLDAIEEAYREGAKFAGTRYAATIAAQAAELQRLQDISEADAVAEGCCGAVTDHGIARSDFIEAWNGIYGPDAWAANPWVAALTFDVDVKNIDEVNHD